MKEKIITLLKVVSVLLALFNLVLEFSLLNDHENN